MNIWLINHYAVPPKYYPLARQTYFAKNLIARGHTVRIFAASTVHNSDKNLIEDGSLYKEETVEGVDYVYISCKGYRGNGLKRILNMYEFARKLPKVTKNFPRPDAVVATSMPPMSCYKGIKIAKKLGVPAIAEIADLWPESLAAYGVAGRKNPYFLWLLRLEKKIYTRADEIVFTMEGAYDYIKERKWEKAVPEEKVHFINNGVDIKTFDFNAENFRTEDPDLEDGKTFKAVYTGSVRKVNNLGLLLDAAKKIGNGKIKILVYGAGDELESLKKRAEDEKIDNVVFKGRVEKKYVPYILKKADLSLAHNTPSELFRFGISFNKLFDYLAAGRPVLCDFPCPYNPAADGGAAIVTDSPTAENIARAIDRAADMSGEEYARLSLNARKTAEKYDFERLTDKLLAVIEKAK